jgi:hypothetical protein
MDFLASLLANVPPSVFDKDAMAIVLRVMWRDHIRKFFLLDTFLFLVYFAFWIVLVELTASSSTALSYVGETKVTAISTGNGVRAEINRLCSARYPSCRRSFVTAFFCPFHAS